MPMCKFCGKAFQWGRSDDGWIPLEPIESHDGLDRSFQDENGILRADHRVNCTRRGGPAVRVARLAKNVPASDIIQWSKPDPDTGEISPISITP
jgi:hypothetical protein